MSVESIITENLDIWTSAIKTKSTSGRGSSSKFELYGIQKLRDLIYDLAVKGKLVSQNTSEESASKLLEKIALEKKQSKKRIAKSDGIRNSSDKKLFKVSPNWKWSNLGEVSQDVFYGFTASASFDIKSVKFLRITDIQNDKVNWQDVPGCEISNAQLEKYKLENDDILIARTGGTVGKSYLVENLDDSAVFASYLICVKALKNIYAPFVKVFLNSPFYWEQLRNSTNGTGQPNVNATALKQLDIPIPPYLEQMRISEKVSELMALCDQLESQTEASIEAHQTLVKSLLETLTNAKDADELNESWQRISEHFDVLFTTEDSIDQLKQTILQLAVMGKLVKQDPNDEPASKLLERIAAEKDQLIKDKKIKKQKPLPPISEEEKWFSSPDSWSWIRLGELGYILGGGTPSKANKEFWGGEIPWVSPKDMKLDFIESALDTVTNEAIDNTNASIIPVGSLLMVVRGMILAHSFPVAITKKALIINQDMKALVFSQVLPEYALLIMKSYKDMVVGVVDRSSHGTCKLVSEKLFNVVLPIPPKREQSRILEKLSELELLQNELKSKIAKRSSIENNICDAIIVDNQDQFSQPSRYKPECNLSDELLKSVWDSLGARSKYIGYIGPRNVPRFNYLGMMEEPAGLTVLGRDGEKGVRYTRFSQLVKNLKSIVFVENKLGLSGIPLLGGLLTSILNSFGFEVKLDQKAALVLLCFPPSLRRTGQEILDMLLDRCKQYKLQTIDEEELGTILNHFCRDGLMTKQSNGSWLLKEKFKHEVDHW